MQQQNIRCFSRRNITRKQMREWFTVVNKMRVKKIMQCMLCVTFIRWRLIHAKSVIKGRHSNMGVFEGCETWRMEATRRCKNLVVAIRSTNDELNHRDPGWRGRTGVICTRGRRVRLREGFSYSTRRRLDRGRVEGLKVWVETTGVNNAAAIMKKKFSD